MPTPEAAPMPIPREDAVLGVEQGSTPSLNIFLSSNKYKVHPQTMPKPEAAPMPIPREDAVLGVEQGSTPSLNIFLSSDTYKIHPSLSVANKFS